MKNLAKAIRALAQPAQGATESAAGQKADTVRDCMDKTMALAKKQLNHYKECAPSADPLYNALLNDGIIVEKSADPLAQSLEVERLKDELAALNLAYDSAMRVGTKRAIEAQSQQEPVAWRCRGRASIAHEWDSWSVKGYKPQGPESERFQIEPLYAAPQPAQDGMVMVPREPTEVMIEEWNYACRDQPGCAFWEPSYLAMISAAPDAKPTDGGKKP